MHSIVYLLLESISVLIPTQNCMAIPNLIITDVDIYNKIKHKNEQLKFPWYKTLFVARRVSTSFQYVNKLIFYEW